MKNFFVSYNQADRKWAEWIAWQLEEAGYDTLIQAWDIRPGSNFVVSMQSAMEKSERTIAVLSPDYVKAQFTQPEWAAAFAQDPTGDRGVLVPVRVREMDLRGIWVAIVYIDLVRLTEVEAKQALLSGIAPGRAKPAVPPLYPGEAPLSAPPVRTKPTYPVSGPIVKDPLWDWSVLDAKTTADGTLAVLFREQGATVSEISQVQLSLSQRQFIDSFLEQTASFMATGDFGVALFQLLIPDHMKERLTHITRLCLVLDEQSACYPWEMMQERQNHGGKKMPLSVQSGMIRQLPEKHFREPVMMAHSQTALVIGNPRCSYVSLPGAEVEARKVHELLGSSGYDSVGQIGAESTSIIQALYARDYRIIHFAGHGVYDDCDHCYGAEEIVNKVTGMVIGDRLFLTPAQLEQMRAVPELIFIDLSHLGEINDLVNGKSSNCAPKMAAHIAIELMRIGVKAVVATGWEVDDAASVTFALEFYRVMLSGESFATAVSRARVVTYEAHSTSTAWGAFHCYGDPDFSLDKLRGHHT